MNGPVFLALERLDLQLALDDQAQRRALHAPGRKSAADLLPQQRRKVETHQIIQCPSCLLCIDQRHRNIAWRSNRLVHRVFGDLVEHHALDQLVLGQLLVLENLGDMPGNRFALAVRVGCQINRIRRLDRLGNRIHMPGVALDHLILHGEIVFGIDSAGFRHQIAHVAVRSQHFKILIQIFLQRFGFGGRFND